MKRNHYEDIIYLPQRENSYQSTSTNPQPKLTCSSNCQASLKNIQNKMSETYTNGTNGTINGDAKWKEIEIDIGWGVIRGKQMGNCGEKILAVHGWLDNANSFDPLSPYLYDKNTVLCLDLPGHGKSDHFKGGFIYDPRGYMGAIKKAVLKLEWGKFTYIGHSMGALVGILYAATFPDDLDALISIDIISIWAFPPEKQAKSCKKYYLDYFKHEETSNMKAIEYCYEELVEKTMEVSKSLDKNSAEILLRRGSTISKCGSKRILTRDLRAKSYFIGFLSEDVWIAHAKDITCPILIIKANQGHLYKPEDKHEKELNAFKENCAHFQFERMDGKHHLHMSHHHNVGTKIVGFLQKVSEEIMSSRI